MGLVTRGSLEKFFISKIPIGIDCFHDSDWVLALM